MTMAATTSGDTRDAIVVGAGIGGLTAAALLSRAGLRVCVVEQASQVGGCLASFDRGGFRFDTSIHWLNQCAPGGLARKVLDFIGPDSPPTRPAQRIRRMKGDSFDYLLTCCPDDLRDTLIRDYPAEEKGLCAFFRAAQSVGRSLARSADLFRTTHSMGLVERSLFGLRSLPSLLPLIRYLPSSAEKGLGRFFAGRDMHRVFCSEENLLSCLVPIGWAYTGDYQHPPETGASAFPQWLARVVERSGGEVLLGSRVSRILLDRGRVSGVAVRTAAGERDLAAGLVMAGCDVESLYRGLLPPGADRGLLGKLDRARIYKSAFTIHLGLDCSPGQLSLGEESVVLTRDGLSREEHNRTDPHTMPITVLCPSLRNPSMAPPGKSTLTIFVPAAYDHAGCWQTGRATDGTRVRGEEYRAYKQQFAGILIGRVEAGLVPGLRGYIEVREVATPITYQRYTGNRLGSMMGFLPCAQNMRARVARYRTSVPGLFVCGQWAECGGGVPSAMRAAANACLLALEDTVPGFCSALKDVADGRRSPADAREGWERSRPLHPGPQDVAL